MRPSGHDNQLPETPGSALVPIITLTLTDIQDQALQQRYGDDLAAWLLRIIASEAQDVINVAAKQRLPELLKNEAFMAELVPLVRKHNSEAM
jgi:hypothetical protein